MFRFLVRRAHHQDAPQLKTLLHEWLNWDPQTGRIQSIKRAIRNKELLVAETQSQVVGFIHFILHEDIIDGAPNSFITAFYVQARYRGKGLGTKLLEDAVSDAAARGATFIETSTLDFRAKKFYERRGFKQTSGNIGEVFLELDMAGTPGTPKSRHYDKRGSSACQIGMSEPHHIKAKVGDVAKRVVVSGDPARVVQLSEILERRKLVNENRGFLTYTGEYEGQMLTVACHGVGGPSAAIVVEELTMLGARAIVRLGSCGGLLRPMRIGDVVVVTGAGYKGGTLDHYFGKKIVPRPDSELTELLRGSVKAQGIKHYMGRVFSTDAFYAEDPGFVKKSARGGYVAVEMECATLFGLGRLRGVRTASVLLVSDNIAEAVPMVDAQVLGERAARVGKTVFTSLNRLQV